MSITSLSANAAQGATSITLSNPPSGLTAGMMLTVPLPSGNRQLVMLTADLPATFTTLYFEPPLREAVPSGTPIETANPYAQVALTNSEFSWNVSPGQQYGISFDVEEVF